MVGSVGNGLADLGASMNGNGKAAAEPLPMEMDPPADVMAAAAAAEGEAASNGRREIVMGRNVHTSCFAVKEPDANDEETGEREATMASVLALYRRSLVGRPQPPPGTSPPPPPFRPLARHLDLVRPWPDLVTRVCAGRFGGGAAVRVIAFLSVVLCSGIFVTRPSQNAVEKYAHRGGGASILAFFMQETFSCAYGISGANPQF